MLVFPQWRPNVVSEGCTVQRWIPAEPFAPYFARPVVPPPTPQTEDEDSSGGSSPERSECTEGSEFERCEWRGCGATFLSVARLSAHVARLHAHAHRDGLFYCAWKGCARPQKGFNARYKMLVHVRTHTNERPHTCNQCQKSFSRAENLKIHLRSHSGEKPYICPFEGCGKAYSNSSDRFKHTRTHTVDKPYCCKVPGCNKRYTDPSSLRKHVKTYKHFVTDDKKDSSDEQCSPSDNSYESSVIRENYYGVETVSPAQRIAYSPPTKATMSPLIPPYNPILPEPPMSYNLSHSYLEPYIRVPSYDMSYREYSQMYEHTYRSYYTNVGYPMRPTVIEKVLTYEEPRVEDVAMEEVREKESPDRVSEDAPLNLICTKKIECRPFEQLVKLTDMPLDLSTKS